MRRLTALALAALAAVSFSALAQQNFDDAEVVAVEVADGIYMLTGAGGNMALSVGPDGAFLVDDQFAPLNDKIKAAVAEVSDSAVKFVMNTHWHGDHTGGNAPFGEAGAIIVAHENVRRRMDPGTFTDVMGRTNQAEPVALPVVTFQQDVSLWWNGHHIEARHVPSAHTDGDSIVWFRDANVVHMGDNLFNGSFPFIDLDSGGSVDGMIAAADEVLAEADDATRFIPGHGPLAGIAQVRAFRDMLSTVRDRVQAHIDAGMNLAQILEAAPTAEYDEQASGFMPVERFVGIVYKSLSGKDE